MNHKTLFNDTLTPWILEPFLSKNQTEVFA